MCRHPEKNISYLGAEPDPDPEKIYWILKVYSGSDRAIKYRTQIDNTTDYRQCFISGPCSFDPDPDPAF